MQNSAISSGWIVLSLVGKSPLLGEATSKSVHFSYSANTKSNTHHGHQTASNAESAIFAYSPETIKWPLLAEMARLYHLLANECLLFGCKMTFWTGSSIKSARFAYSASIKSTASYHSKWPSHAQKAKYAHFPYSPKTKVAVRMTTNPPRGDIGLRTLSTLEYFKHRERRKVPIFTIV